MSESTIQDLVEAIRKAVDRIVDSSSDTCCRVGTASVSAGDNVVAIVCLCPDCGDES